MLISKLTFHLAYFYSFPVIYLACTHILVLFNYITLMILNRVDILLIAGTKSKSVGETETMHRQVREGHKINIF